MSSFERLLAQKLADPAVKAGFDDAARRRRIATDEAGQPLYAEHQPTEKRRDPARCGHCGQTTEGA